MNKTFLVLKHELITVLTSPSFLLALFGIPLIGALVFYLASGINQSEEAQSVITQAITSSVSSLPEGFVDHSGVIKTIPENVPEGAYIAFPNETAASAALQAGEISGYYVIPPDYLEQGEVIFMQATYSPLASGSSSSRFESLMTLNLLGDEAGLIQLIGGPTHVERVSLAPAPERDSAHPMTFYLPYGVTIVFYVVILGAASMLLSSITKEKETRVLEVLMSTVTPAQLLAGKITGLGLVGLLQTVVWVGIGRLLLVRGETAFNLPQIFQLPPSFVVWALVFFALGYAVYASLMAGLGALVPNMREASQATIVIVLPLLVPMFMVSVLAEKPDGFFSVFLSLFPLTSPVAMMTRLAAGEVPPWQLLLAVGLLILTAWLVVKAAARLFRAQSLLSGQPFTIKVFLKALFGGKARSSVVQA